ncbi:hypothetical protein P170DRAFT_25099 [Aspergillus steynii IBT 23096]|uniref:Velvet domain-containing protein n=1 Tax=Aspergillus steynii IBT 23096 TaxID=1392250 RepID=A0A2I2GPK2_9EURO|nr:uncharacterized protein P170DRAFT_25099 [Aspergillus steynii IBT 23096]PLB54807.1 hypothetical protein P170DRAFT_25099 [Aspergillus steynii IBT 23096]
MSRTPLQWHTVYPDGWYFDGRRRVSDDENQRMASTSNNPFSPGPHPPQFLHPDNRGYDPTMISPSQPRSSVYGRPRESAAEPEVAFSSGSMNSMAPHGAQRSNLFKVVDYGGAHGSYDHRGSIGSSGRVNDMDSQYSSSSTTFPSPVHSDKSMVLYPQNVPFAKQQQQQQQQHQQQQHPLPPPQHSPPRHTTSSMPLGFEKLLNHSPSPSPPPSLPPPRRPSSSSRYHLHIRQQPLAARACGAGDRDRRPVDPPPIIQMLLTDFDPHSDTDSDILQDPRFAVGCLLVPVSGSADLDAEPGVRENRLAQRDGGGGGGQTTPLLSGKAFVSPFYVGADPDPDTAPAHPSSIESLYTTAASSASTTSTTTTTRTTPTDPRHRHTHHQHHRPPPHPSFQPPATFYIFSDLSVRTAGLYQLQFRLMNWGAVEDTGQSMGILAEAWSDPFRVFPAKDFPGMRDSSALTRGLKELGFVELKTRGRGEGKGRRAR